MSYSVWIVIKKCKNNEYKNILAEKIAEFESERMALNYAKKAINSKNQTEDKWLGVEQVTELLENTLLERAFDLKAN